MTSSGGEEREAPHPVNDPCSGPHRQEIFAQVRRYAEHLAAYASSYGPTGNLTDAQRFTRDQMQTDGEIVLAILDGEEWALRDVTL